MSEIFDQWPEVYDQWFETPIGRLIREYETELILEMLQPGDKELILDAGCGTGIFTQDVLSKGAHVVGLELSFPMMMRARIKCEGYPFLSAQGDMRSLPFHDNRFEKAMSVTAIEFIEDVHSAINELLRVTKPRGSVIVATLNSLSPWAARRKARAEKGQSRIFEKVIFRSPDELRKMGPGECLIKTAVHFQQDDAPEEAQEIELQGQVRDLDTGAFLAARWEKE